MEETQHVIWERRQAELWDRIFQATQDVVTLAEGLSDAVGLGHVRHELVRAAMAVGANLVRANASDSVADFERYVIEARMKAIEADYWLRLIYVLQQRDNVQQDLSSIITQFSSIIRLLQSFLQHTHTTSDALSRHAKGPKVTL